ncbi:hypothetical protein M406DRAFT_345427 [Cryphonectria parasitica EP155]|uniref:RING-type domain-containing protein n=1 Tax=Cryphonectria parasitica (strain ATCC 38755 / EP155) TaxID=660469 RepID=A0A9P4Y6I6_CRYP1|nr:uncharacterized protein M406DRAFT_345427 [Cryphonectria parasitica EP155]KAF3767396.1 hypothetical protein M406DRAFT_345427 [Cryphonectria parasitica EP155]
MIFSALSPSPDTDQAVEYLYDDSQLQPPSPEPPDLRDLNNSLEALTAVFPDVQIEVFREMLSSFDQESRLAVVADALLKNRIGWVKGRWRSTAGPTKSTLTSSLAGEKITLVPPAETFKSPEYIAATKGLAWHEFRGLPRSTINAVLAECNYSYLEARRTLVDLSQKSWRFTLSSLVYRRKPVTSAEAEGHPLVVWKSTGQGSIVPSLRSTGNAELDRELFQELVVPLKKAAREKLEEEDLKCAAAMNMEEAEAENQTHECCCCFTDSPFEDFTACSNDGHMICVRCVHLSINEAIFGQGWAKSIIPQTGTLRCPAVPTTTSADPCDGWIPSDQMHRAMLGVKKGASIMLKLEQRLADHNLSASGLPVIRCPFCDYAEVDDIYVEGRLRLKIENLHNVVLVCLVLAFTPFLLAVTLLSLFLALLFSSEQTFGDRVMAELYASVARHRRRQRGLRFTCQSPACGRASCLSCGKAWTDIHVCHESSLVALRTQVEQAMSMAVKRVCPRCNASFVKTAGCNKMTCQCGYKMCYVCRRDIGGQEGEDAGYQHFCQHFRPQGDGRPCTSCNKCNLWEKEDTDAVLQKAKEEVERKWKKMENRDLSGAEMAFLETGVAVKGKDQGLEAALVHGRLPTIAEICDMIVGNLFA